VNRLADALIETLDLPFALDGIEVRVRGEHRRRLLHAEGGAEALLSNADIACTTPSGGQEPPRHIQAANAGHAARTLAPRGGYGSCDRQTRNSFSSINR